MSDIPYGIGSLDATHDPAIDNALNSQSGSNADLAKTYSAGASATRGLLNNPDSGQGLSYGDRAVSDAIRSRSSAGYNRSMNELSLNTMRSAQEDHLRNLQVATNAATQEVEQNKQKAILKWKIDQANKSARGAILGTTLGIVGGVAGAAMTGGAAAPGGAMAGYALGSGVGNMAGGS